MSAVAKTETYTRAYAESNGFLTLLSDGERLTGAYALGPEAGEWLQQATLAIRARVPLDVLRDTIQPFPTFSEIYVDALKALRVRDLGPHRRQHEHRTRRRPAHREPELLGQTVVVIGGSSGIGLETARAARAEGAEVIITGRDHERLERAAREVGALSTAAFDATDPDALDALLRRPSGADRPPDALGPAAPTTRRWPRSTSRRCATRLDQHLLLPSRSRRMPSARCGPAGRWSSSAARAAAAAASAWRSSAP